MSDAPDPTLGLDLPSPPLADPTPLADLQTEGDGSGVPGDGGLSNVDRAKAAWLDILTAITVAQEEGRPCGKGDGWNDPRLCFALARLKANAGALWMEVRTDLATVAKVARRPLAGVWEAIAPLVREYTKNQKRESRAKRLAPPVPLDPAVPPKTFIELIGRDPQDAIFMMRAAIRDQHADASRRFPLFNRRGSIVYVDDAGDVAPESMHSIRTAIGDAVCFTQDGMPCGVPRDFPGQYLEMKDNGLPPLLQVIRTPYLSKTGDLITGRSYDSETGTLLRVPDSLALPPIPEDPTDEECQAAGEWLRRPFLGYRADPVSLANMSGWLLTHGLRPMLPSKQLVPLYFCSAARPSCGKTTAQQAAAALLLGRDAHMTSAQNIEELIKGLDSALLDDSASIILDNIGFYLASPRLDSLLTAERRQVRAFGALKTRECGALSLLAANANSPRVTADLQTRMMVSHIEGHGEGENPQAFVLANRPAILAACLTLARAAIKRGVWDMPTGEEKQARQFIPWRDRISQVLRLGGIRRFAEGLGAPSPHLSGSADDDGLLAAIGIVCRGRWFVVGQLAAILSTRPVSATLRGIDGEPDLALSDVDMQRLAQCCPPSFDSSDSRRSAETRLGTILSKRRGAGSMTADGLWRIESHPDQNRRSVYRITSTIDPTL